MDKFTVRDSNGTVDVVASATAYAEALSAWVAENEADTQQLTDMVNACFDNAGGKTLSMPYLVSQVVSGLGVSPAEHKATTKRVHEHVRCMAGEGGALVIAKGKGGGVSRKSDAPVSATE